MRRTPSGIVLGPPADSHVLVVGAPSRWLADALEVFRELGNRFDQASSCDGLTLAWIADLQPDLVLLDAATGGALEVCRTLKSHASTSLMPVIVRGADGDSPAERLEAIEAGCDHWLAHDAPVEELRVRALVLLRTRGVTRSLLDTTDHLRLRRDWVRYLVHDLRNPLMALRANVQYIRDTLGAAINPVAIAFDEVEYLIDSSQTMLHDLLDVDRLQRGELIPESGPVDLFGVMRKVEGELQFLARERRLTTTVYGEPVTVMADASLIRRVIGNLFGNALRYARSAIQLSVEAGERAVIARVANDGPGIPDVEREQIFLPFVQIEGGRMGGAGLGLAFTKLVAKAHGGKLELESWDDGNVCFALTLPR